MQNMDRVAVIGCGTVGQSWAALFMANGLDVTVHDPAVKERDDALRPIMNILPALREIGLRGEGSLSVASSPEEACRDARLIQENAPERPEEKSDLLGRLDEASPAEAIIASSTSSLLWSDITGRCRNRNRVIIAHPFNPPHLVPLVELYGPDRSVVDRAMAFYSRIGKRPVRLNKEMKGHIANRLSSALYREAVHLVEQGVASVADIDAALRDGPGLRWSIMGAHLTYHLGGGRGGIRHYLDHLGSSQERRWQDLGQPKLTDDLKGKLIEGVDEEIRDASIDQLERERDDALLRVMKVRGDMVGDAVRRRGD